MKQNEVVDELKLIRRGATHKNTPYFIALTEAIRCVELMPEIKEYIESTEETIDGEWGSCRSIEELINDNKMPDLWHNVCELLGDKAKGEA